MSTSVTNMMFNAAPLLGGGINAAALGAAVTTAIAGS